MLNEVRARHLKKLVVEQIKPGVSIGGILSYEITSREHTIRGLEAHIDKERDEIAFLKSLDAKDLQAEKEKKDD